MPRRKQKAGLFENSSDSMAPLRKSLSERTKAELVDVLLELAESDRKVVRHLAAHFNVAAAPSELVAETHQAIIDATAFDMREMNRNFNYDHAAYDQVKRNLQRLLKVGQLRQAMELALELMKRGSHQVEMSDEGLMTSEIEECLSVVLDWLAKSDLPADELIDWCSAMLKADRVEFIATDELRALRDGFQTRAGKRQRQK